MVKQLDANIEKHKFVIEQNTLYSIVQQHKPRMKWLDISKFPCGKWYDNSNRYHGLPIQDYANQPIVIQNNWIVGNAAKIQRAKKWGHWYYSGKYDKCLPF